MDYDNLSSLRTAAGLDYTETLPTSNIDADLAQLSRLSGMSIEQYYLMKPKEKTFPAIDLRIDPLTSYNTPKDILDQPESYDLSKLAELLRSSEKEDQGQPSPKPDTMEITNPSVDISNISSDIATQEQLKFITDQLEVCYGKAKPDMEDPVVYTIIQEALALEKTPDYKTVLSIFSALYPKMMPPVFGYYGGYGIPNADDGTVPDDKKEEEYDQGYQEEISEEIKPESVTSEEVTEEVIESNSIVPEIETESGSPRYSTLNDESGDVSILDIKRGITLNFSGLEAAEIKSHVKSTTGSELQVYLAQFFDADSTITEEMDGYVSPDNWADEAVQVAEYLAELISEMEGTTLIDTFLIGQLSNFIKRHGIK